VLDKKKIVIFGCQQIAVDFIDYLLSRSDVEIPLVVTYELPLDEVYGYESVYARARAKGLNVINPPRITPEIISEVKKINPDIVFSVYYRKIFSNELLSIPRQGCINIHPSKLPLYRGPVPTAWAILNGETSFGITIHHMDDGVDTGDILVAKEFPIHENETGFELYSRGMKLGAELLRENFSRIIQGEVQPRKQIGQGSYYGKLSGRHVLNWRQSVGNVRNLVRVHAKPYNPVQAILFNKYVLINRISVANGDTYTLQGAGIILDILEGDRLVVSCTDGCVIFEDYEIVPKLTEKERCVYLRKGNRFD
jgi:methionyl-tRNA formyltransferase